MRLIDADALIERLRSIRDLYGTKTERERAARGGVVACICAVHDAPTVTAEQKRGTWETWGFEFCGIKWKRCSVCGKVADISYESMIGGAVSMATPEYCGCCGAKMDGGAENG